MLRTPFCNLIGIERPIMQGAIWPATAPELVAAVSNAGGLGSLGAVFESANSLAQAVAKIRALTDRPFAINHVVPLLNEDAFAITLEAKPAVLSLALGDPGDLVDRAHAVGIKVIHQVHTAEQARQAAARGVDAIIAQGAEAGGQGLAQGPSTLVLVPQVVDAVSPLPVLAAGGIADGRGLAAALTLGAQGINIGTRFLAAEESSATEGWKQAIVAAEAADAIRFETWQAIMPATSSVAYDAVPRVLRTPFVEQWTTHADDASRQAEQLRSEIMNSVRERRVHEVVPFAGQTVGLIHTVQPAAEIMRDIVTEAERALTGATNLIA